MSTGATDRTKLYTYKVDRRLGSGGSGTVYRGIDRESGQVYALKLFKSNYFKGRSHIKDLAKSAQKFKEFSHMNIVRIFDFIDGEEGVVLVMEYVDGPSLAWYIENRPWNLQERLMICAQLCNGLQYLHDRGFRHHDLKPANVLFTRTGVAKLSDFSLYQPGLFDGIMNSGLKDLVTPMFIAPELLSGKKTSPQSDIYSFGVTMYIMFTGQTPFAADNLQVLYEAHKKTKPEHPCIINSKIPRALGDLIMTALAKDPKERWHDCDVLRVKLGEIGQSRI